MAIEWSNASHLYFKKIIRKDAEQVSLDANMIRLLLAIDEHRSLNQIADAVDMDTITLKQALAELLKRGLIEPVRRSAPHLDRMFYDALRINLSKAIGPMAEILIEDAAAEMNLTLNRIPVDQAAELITNISYEIPDDENRILFKKSMIQILGKLTPR
jgi:predicted transcriptional regulator